MVFELAASRVSAKGDDDVIIVYIVAAGIALQIGDGLAAIEMGVDDTTISRRSHSKQRDFLLALSLPAGSAPKHPISRGQTT
jgi:hypothetical protein